MTVPDLFRDFQKTGVEGTWEKPFKVSMGLGLFSVDSFIEKTENLCEENRKGESFLWFLKLVSKFLVLLQYVGSEGGGC